LEDIGEEPLGEPVAADDAFAARWVGYDELAGMRGELSERVAELAREARALGRA